MYIILDITFYIGRKWKQETRRQKGYVFLGSQLCLNSMGDSRILFLDNIFEDRFVEALENNI